MSLHDQTRGTPPLRTLHRSTLLLAGIAGCLAGGGVYAQADLSDPALATTGPIRTAPSMRGLVLSTATAPTASSAGQLPVAAKEADAPWVLAPEQHPWPLRYSAPAVLNTLLLDIPTVQDARLMLPGRAADAVENARFATNKYLTDVLGMAVQDRRKQAELLEQWLERVALQAREVDSGEWPQYQFNREARKTMSEYRAQLAGQSEAGMQQLLTDARDAILRMNEVMPVMTTHELSMGWYNIMVQLRNGVAMYQAQVEQSDARVLALADDFLAQTPEVPRPQGPAPAQVRPGMAAPAVAASAPSVKLSAPVAPAPAPELKAESQDTLGGMLVVGGGLVAMLLMALRLRKRREIVKTPL